MTYALQFGEADEAAKQAVYLSALRGYYDVSEESQRENLLTVSVTDISSMGVPQGAARQLLVNIDRCTFFANIYPNGSMSVQPDEKRGEYYLRMAIFDHAVAFWTGGKYQPGAGMAALAQAIQPFLEEYEGGGTYGGFPVIREEKEAGPGYVRQWRVTCGYHLAYVALTQDAEGLQFAEIVPLLKTVI